VLPTCRDAVLAGLVGGVVLALTWVHADRLDRPLPPIYYVLVAVGSLALAWRQRWPLAVLVVAVVAVVPGYALESLHGPAMGIVAVAVYTVSTRIRWPSAVALGAVLVLVWAGAEAVGGRLTRDEAVPDPLAWVVVFVAVGVAVGASRRLRALRAVRDEQQRRLDVERERLRIAQEVHDVVSHSLAMINVQAGVALHVADRRPEQSVLALREIRDASRIALADLRTTLAVLREPDESDPAVLPPSPVVGLHRLPELVRAGEAAGLDVALRCAPGTLSPLVDRTAFRIAQEAVTNVIRHATGARRLTIDLDRGDGVLTLRIGDDGGRSEPPEPRHGLRGMAERASAVGGTIAAGPNGEGFVVLAEIPVRSAQ